MTFQVLIVNIAHAVHENETDSIASSVAVFDTRKAADKACSLIVTENRGLEGRSVYAIKLYDSEGASA